MNDRELRQALVDSLIENKILTSPWTVRAFQQVPRHLFVPQVPLEEAYEDKIILHKMVDNELLSTASQPTMIGIMLEQLELKPGHKVLEIGAGTGYNAALMAAIVGEEGLVVTIDIDDDLVDGARACLDEAGFPKVQTICADGGHGYAQEAPYDRIILTVSATDVTTAWMDQLKDDGRIVMPISILQKQVSVALEKEQVQVEVAADRVEDTSSEEEAPADFPEPVEESEDGAESEAQLEGQSKSQHEVTRLRAISRSRCQFVTLRGEFSVYVDEEEPEGEQEPEPVIETVSDLEIIHHEDFTSDPAQILAWLEGSYEEHKTDVMLTLNHFTEGLWTWLLLHNLPLVRVDATNEMVDRGIVPVTAYYADDQKFVSTSGLISETGMALFANPPHISNTPLDLNPHARNFPYQPAVRAYGDDPALAERLVEVCKLWLEAGTPHIESMDIYVYPNMPREWVADHQFVVEKRWSFVGLDY